MSISGHESVPRRREPGRRHVIRGLMTLACIALAPAGFRAGPPERPAPRIEVHARAIAPGEPLRVVVAADRPLARLTGRFLGRSLDFLPAGGGGLRYVAWAVVPLDAPPGADVIDVSGEGPEGAAIHATLAVEIEPRDFPVETLSVDRRYVEPPPEVARRLARERARLREIYARRTVPAGDGGPFVAPVPGAPTSVFGTRRVFNGQPRDPHPGLDLRAETGTPVRAAGPGVVALAGDLYYSGNTVLIDHGGGLFTIYAHLSRIDVTEGERVAAGKRIGLSGATGRVTGPHLHWGAKIGDEPFDPRALLSPELFSTASDRR